MTKISIIVPVYNVEKYVKKCIKSLMSQTLKDIEIIVVDDGSTDNSMSIVEELAKDDERIKIFHKEHGGLSDARNYGLKKAKGKYIAFLDSDDYVKADLYQKMYEKAKKEKSDMVECNFFWAYPKDSSNNSLKKDIGEKYSNQIEMMEKARVVAWNKLYKKEIIDKVGVEFPKGLRYEDIEFFYKLIPYIENVSFVKQPMIYYVQRKESIVNTQNEKTNDIFEVFDNVFEYYKEHQFYDKYKEALEYTYTRILLCSSFKRIVKIKDKQVKSELLNKTWISLNEKFPYWKNNKILNTNLNKKKRYMLSMNRVTYRIYAKIFGIF